MNSSEDTDKVSEAVPRCLKEDLTHSFEVVLKDLPEVLAYIKRLNEHIQKQQDTLVKLYEKLKEYKQLSHTRRVTNVDVSTQTDPLPDLTAAPADIISPPGTDDQCTEWTGVVGADTGRSLADEVKKVAESAMQQTGFVYEETSGMYYDYNTGYYYNAEMGLYYDGNSGTYLYYNETTKSYEYHSHATVPAAHVESVKANPKVVPSAPVSSKVVEDLVVALVDSKIKAKLKKSEKDVSTLVSLEPDLSKIVVDPVDVVLKTKTKAKSKKKAVPKPDPLEAKENELDGPGSNPMAPVIPEPSKASSQDESNSHENSSHGSRHERKRKSKHKKHKSKKKKKKRHRSHSRGENSLEEGECSDSSEVEIDVKTENSLANSAEEKVVDVEETSAAIESFADSSLKSNIEQPWKKYRRLSDEASEAWPPCMRIIVQNTEVKNLNVGTLFIVTCKGGTLGREKSHAVSIPDINISKHHGIFSFDEESKEGKYFFTDYGSRNGTYVNKQRLSVAKQESEPCEIPHGTIITLGSTDLLCHIHPGRETCEECEPGVVAAKKAEDFEALYPTPNIVVSKSSKRLQELKRLRKRFGLESNDSKAELLAPGYEDRAEIRRVTVGSHNEHAKTEMASSNESIRSTNKGFKMLSKMGWKEGESLGKDGTGLTEPVLVSQRAEKAGLGADNAFSGPVRLDAKTKTKADIWQRARQRYGQLPDTVDDAMDDE